jgi:PAB-dependent poly(A)-specific ribonuclease subunit 3
LQLDVGSAERITLVSPDEKNVMIVSYHDLKRALQVTFQDLAGSAFV